MKQIYFIFLILYITNTFSQYKYDKEIGFFNDNDLFTSISQDRYYTNGILLTYQYLSKNKYKKTAKKIFKMQIGHQMYTPFKATVSEYSDHDRPFAGYLFGDFGINHFYKNKTILKTSLQIGTIGSLSMSQELQDFIHSIYGFEKAIGWEYQIKNAIGINLDIKYVKNLVEHSFFDINWTNNIKAGTIYSDLSTGFYARIGLKPLQGILNSIAFNGNLNNKNTNYFSKNESFIYIKPIFSYVAYDATIQGSFLNKKSAVTYNIRPFKFAYELGIRFTINQFNVGYAIHYHTKKLESVRVPEQNFYGTIQLNYLFGRKNNF